jgi:hypothetical protein
MTQPIGTSPAAPALSAAFRAKFMKEGAFMPRILKQKLLNGPHSAKVNAGYCEISGARMRAIAF